MIPEPVLWALLALVILCLCGVIWLANAFPESPYPWQEQEVPPPPEAPAVPPAFRPRKHKAVQDRLAWRTVHPREAEATARHARQLHFHDAEEAEARHG